MKNLSVLALCLISFFTFSKPVETYAASNEWGNGGHGVLCKSNTVSGYQLLDFLEAEKSGIKLKKFDDSLSVEEIGKQVLGELAHFAPQRAVRYKELFENILKTYQLTSPNSKLVISQDYGYISIPKECELIQLGMQISDHVTNKITVVFQRESWVALSNMNKAALIMHEVVLLDLAGYEERHPTTQRARNFIGFLFSENFIKMTKRNFVETLLKLQFKFVEVGENEFPLFYKNKFDGTIDQNILEWEDDNTLQSYTWSGEFKYRKLFNFSCKSNSLNGKVILDRNGVVEMVQIGLYPFESNISVDCPVLEFPFILTKDFVGKAIGSNYRLKNDVILEVSRVIPFPALLQEYLIVDKKGEILKLNFSEILSYRLVFNENRELQNIEVPIVASRICGIYSEEFYSKFYVFYSPVIYQNGAWMMHETCKEQ